MVTELQYIAYFTNLATQHRQIGHVEGKKDAFFFIPLAYDLAEIDKAVRNTKSAPFLALDAVRGSFNDNESESHIQIIEGQITIADKVETGKVITIREAQDKCLQICRDILARMKYDSRKRQLIQPLATMRINNVQYEPVGPMAVNHYGYTMRFEIACPFGYTVDSGTWLDK
jgi:hypothetical protein